MTFAPAPPNDFAEFCAVYHERCRNRVPAICAVAAKWTFEDLIPGLSDFDTRFILRHPMSADDWRAMSLAIGEVHTELAIRHPHWHRYLEHLPGVNLTDAELLDPRLDSPESRQWTFYAGDPPVIERITDALAKRPWSRRDELYHLKKVATFYGPYVRGIDPPVNLKAFETKYPLHSRYMHYFTPPVQAMVSLKLRRTVKGKFESLRLARDLFPRPAAIDRVLDAVDRHYECPSDYDEPRLSQIERELERYLCAAWGALAGDVTLVEHSAADDREAIRRKVNALAGDPVGAFFNSTRFARQMEGRLRFYAADVPGFDHRWLIDNELGRMAENLFRLPLRCYALARYGLTLEPAQVLDRLRGELLTTAQADDFLRFVQTLEHGTEQPDRQQAAARVADAFPIALIVIERLGHDLTTRAPITQ